MWIRRGDLFSVSLDPVRGSEQGGTRPVLVIQNDIGNRYASTVIVAPLTTKIFPKPYPTNVHLLQGAGGLRADSTVLLSQIRTIDRRRLGRKIGHLTPEAMLLVSEAVKVSLALT